MNNKMKFWEDHSKDHGGLEYFGVEFINLINGLLEYNPEKRFGYKEVLEHPWL